MTKSVLAAQMYTLRDFTKTPADIASTLKKVKQIGYDVVQLSAHGPIDTKELKKMLDGEGLTCCATHVPIEKLRDDLSAVADEHRILDCKYPAIGAMPVSYRSGGKPAYQQFAREVNDVARKMKEQGLVFGYHNHSFELEKFGERTGLDILIEETDKNAVTFEIDTYWIQHGGGDPAAWINKVKGRMPLVHLKDMVVAADKHVTVPATAYPGENDKDFQKRVSAARATRPIMAEVGEGNMNWQTILQACKEAGTEWYIVEQDTCQRDPFESLAISLRNLKNMGMK